MGIGEDFKTFCDSLTVKNAEALSNRCGLITRRLNLTFRLSDSSESNSFYAGSYGRNTAINGFSDVDLIYEMPSRLYSQYDKYVINGQSAMLADVRKSIQVTYPDTDIGADGQVVVVNFSDSTRFEVVPAFINDENSYTFPDSNNGGSWKTTNPKPEIEAIRKRNQSCNGNLIQLCRMMRSWKNTWSVPIGGLLVDTLAYQFIETYQYRDKSYLYYDYMTRDFFLWMANQDESQIYWRAPGSNQYVYGKGLFQYKAKRCYNIAHAAIENYTRGELWAGHQRWREIFGFEFPNY